MNKSTTNHIILHITFGNQTLYCWTCFIYVLYEITKRALFPVNFVQNELEWLDFRLRDQQKKPGT